MSLYIVYFIKMVYMYSITGVLVTIVFQMSVHGLIHMNLGVLDMEMFENQLTTIHYSDCTRVKRETERLFSFRLSES